MRAGVRNSVVKQKPSTNGDFIPSFWYEEIPTVRVQKEAVGNHLPKGNELMWLRVTVGAQSRCE